MSPAQPDAAISGSCLCGGVRFELDRPPIDAGYCHCTRCQKRTGGGSSAQARIDGRSFRLTEGEELVKAWRHPDGGFEKCFCRECGAHLFSSNPLDPTQMSVRMGAFDTDPQVRPSWRAFVAYAPPGSRFPTMGSSASTSESCASRPHRMSRVSGFISRGFSGRRRTPEQFADRLPPGQYYESDFPVLTAGPTPDVSTDQWRLRIDGMVSEPQEWSWREFGELDFEEIPCDIHCVTKWSKLGTGFRGVSVDTLLEAAEPLGPYVMAYSYGGYTTNLPVEDISDGKAWVVTEHEGEPLPREHGGPARLLVPHLYFWKSAKWVTGLRVMDNEEPGFWEANGYHNRGDPWKEERYWND